MVIDNFNLIINNGEFFILFGFFGCGKIIVLCFIVGLENVDSGWIYFEDYDIIYVLVENCYVNIVF